LRICTFIDCRKATSARRPSEPAQPQQQQPTKAKRVWTRFEKEQRRRFQKEKRLQNSLRDKETLHNRRAEKRRLRGDNNWSGARGRREYVGALAPKLPGYIASIPIGVPLRLLTNTPIFSPQLRIDLHDDPFIAERILTNRRLSQFPTRNNNVATNNCAVNVLRSESTITPLRRTFPKRTDRLSVQKERRAESPLTTAISQRMMSTRAISGSGDGNNERSLEVPSTSQPTTFIDMCITEDEEEVQIIEVMPAALTSRGGTVASIASTTNVGSPRVVAHSSWSGTSSTVGGGTRPLLRRWVPVTVCACCMNSCANYSNQNLRFR
jgi:hypothetical protein